MTEQQRITLIGGHGKIALLAIPKLTAAGYEVDAVIRNPDHGDDIRAVGGNPLVMDVEQADHDQLASAFAGSSAIVFSAGAGGGSPERTRSVDYDAAVRSMEAATQAGVSRYLMVSYVTAAIDVDRLDPASAFYPYAKAKHDADKVLRESSLDYTILGPARLTDAAASEHVRLVTTSDIGDLPEDQRQTSRDNVASMIAHLLKTGAARRDTVNFLDGDTTISQIT